MAEVRPNIADNTNAGESPGPQSMDIATPEASRAGSYTWE